MIDEDESPTRNSEESDQHTSLPPINKQIGRAHV